MLTTGPAKKVTIFLNEDAQFRATAMHDAVMNFLIHKGVAGATATRAFSGFGSHHALHTPKIELLAQHLPIRIEFIESPEKVEAILPTLREIVSDGIIEVQDTTVAKLSRPQEAAEVALAPVRHQTPAKMLRVFLGENDVWRGEPLHAAIVRKLLLMDIAGATVYKGILGYGETGQEHRTSGFGRTSDLPLQVCVVDLPEKIAAAAEVIEGMIEDGLLVISDVEMIRVSRRAASAAH